MDIHLLAGQEQDYQVQQKQLRYQKEALEIKHTQQTGQQKK